MVFNATFNNITIQLYCGGQFYWWRKPEDPEKTTDLSQDTDNIYICLFVHTYILDALQVPRLYVPPM
jgi:hypothetical protein